MNLSKIFHLLQLLLLLLLSQEGDLSSLVDETPPFDVRKLAWSKWDTVAWWRQMSPTLAPSIQ